MPVYTKPTLVMWTAQLCLHSHRCTFNNWLLSDNPGEGGGGAGTLGPYPCTVRPPFYGLEQCQGHQAVRPGAAVSQTRGSRQSGQAATPAHNPPPPPPSPPFHVMYKHAKCHAMHVSFLIVEHAVCVVYILAFYLLKFSNECMVVMIVVMP